MSVMILAATLDPGGLFVWLVVGLIAGFLASKVMQGEGYGMVGDIVVGVIGAFIGGIITNLVLPNASFGFIGSIVVAFIGACILIAILRAIASNTHRTHV